MKKPMKQTAILLATCALPAVTLAGSPLSGPDVVYRGYVELEHLNSSGSDQNTLGGELFFNWSPTAISSYGFGVTGGFEGITLLDSSSDDYVALWLALTYSMAGGSSSMPGGVLSFGFPTSPIDDYASTAIFNDSILIDAEFSVVKSSFVRYANLLESERPFGVRYDATSGPLSYGIAWHHIDFGSDDANSFSAAARYTSGALTFAGGIEHIDGSGGGSFTAVRAGVEADFDPLKAHLYIYENDSSGPPGGVEVGVSYEVMPNLTVGANFLDIDGSGDLFGVTANYDLANGGYVQAGLMDGDFGDSVIDLSVGYRF